MQPNDNRGIPEVVTETMDKATILVKNELSVFKREMTTELRKAQAGAGLFAAAGVGAIMLAFFGSLTVFFILDLFMWRWLAALIVAVIWAIVAGSTASAGKKTVADIDPVPHETVYNVQRDVNTMKRSVQEDMPVVREDAKSRAQDVYDRTPDSVKDKVAELKDKAVEKLPADVAAKLPSKVTEKDPELDAKKRREQARTSDEGDPITHPTTVDPFTASTLGAYTYAVPTPFDGNPFNSPDPSPSVDTPTPVDPAPPYADPSPSSSYDSGSTDSNPSTPDNNNY